MDDKECDAMTLKAASWFSKAMEQLSCTAPVEVTSTECKKLVKDKLVVLLNESFHLARFQNEKLQQMKMVISLQQQVIDCKEKQLQAVQTADISEINSRRFG